MTMIHIYKDPMLYILGFHKAVNESAQNMVNREPLKTQNKVNNPKPAVLKSKKLWKLLAFSTGLLPKFIWQQNLS